MAKAAKPKKEVSMEEALWKSADKLRGLVEPAEYKHVVLSLFFLKFASDKFEAQRKMIAEKYGDKFVDNIAFYTKDNVFYLPAESRWSFIMENAKQDDIALKIDTALFTIEKTNPALKGALPDNYYSRLHIDTIKLASLLDEIDKINTDDSENDIIGRIYEYFPGKAVFINGSPRKNFNTAKMLKKAIEGAQSVGAECELINLFDYEFTGCRSCFACQMKKNRDYLRCQVKDSICFSLRYLPIVVCSTILIMTCAERFMVAPIDYSLLIYHYSLNNALVIS